MIYTIKNDVLSVSVNTQGGSLTSVKYLNEERQWQGGEYWAGQDVVIFPIIGHAGEYTALGKTFVPKSHGVARYSQFDAESVGEHNLSLALTSSATTMQYYPYGFYLRADYKLEGNTLHVNYFVRSQGGKIPFYVGGHPGMKAPGGEAVIEFEREEYPLIYPVDSDKAIPLGKLKRFVANKQFFAECATFQLGSLSGGAIYALTQDGYRYTYRSNCPVFAFWSNPQGGDYICVEPWWGINDFPSAPRELTLKPFINFADERGANFSYSLTIEKI